MKKRIFTILFAFVLVFSCVVMLANRAGAFGDFDGGYDYGGDVGGNDSYDWDNDNDYDWGNDDNGGGFVYYGGGSGGDYSGGDGSSIIGALVIVAIIVIVVILIKRKNGTAQHPVVQAGGTVTDPSTLKPMSEYRQLDPMFSESAFTEKLSNLFVQFQNGWQAKDLEPLRWYMSDAFFAQMDRQLDSYRINKRTKMIERIAVLGVNLSGWKQENGNDVVIARLNTRFTTYTVDDATGNVLQGSKTAEVFMDYEWQLIRSTGKTTVAEGGVTVQNCPNCGATININRTAKCEYCGSIVTVDSYDWVVNGIKGISQRTVG